MRKLLTVIFGTGCFIAMLLSGATKEDGSCDALWSFGCIAIAIICGLLLIKINPNFRKGGLIS